MTGSIKLVADPKGVAFFRALSLAVFATLVLGSVVLAVVMPAWPR